MILVDKQITSLCQPISMDRVMGAKPMIDPFFPQSIKTGLNGRRIPSYGLSSKGYDIRLGNTFREFAASDVPVDVCKECEDSEYITTVVPEGESFILPPKGFVLGVSMEKFHMPPNVSGDCMGKSTIARVGCIVFVTPLEPAWSGYLTLEIFNTLDRPVRLWPGIGITQIMFDWSDEACETTYADRKGKYDDQPNVPVTFKL